MNIGLFFFFMIVHCAYLATVGAVQGRQESPY